MRELGVQSDNLLSSGAAPDFENMRTSRQIPHSEEK